MTEKVFSKEWSDWILENIARGCSLEDIYAILYKQGFNKSDIEVALNFSPDEGAIAALEPDTPKEKLIKSNVEIFKRTYSKIPRYTQEGFYKKKIDFRDLSKAITFYRENFNNTKNEVVAGNFVTNKDKSKQPSVIIDLPDYIKDEIHQLLLKDLQDWCGIDLFPTYVYGIRVYQEGAILTPHRDREQTHIIGTIINIDQKVEKDWFLEIEDHKNKKHKVTLFPGEVLFYESATLLHGRPEPLKGDYFSNIFSHYMPKLI